MKPRTALYIDILALADGRHEYHLSAGNELFEQFPNDLVQQGNLEVQVVLEKSSTMIHSWLTITGQVQLVCDRSLREFMHPLNIQQELLFKFGETAQELDDDIVVITPNTQRLSLEQAVYDFVILSLPAKKIHPDLRDQQLEELPDGHSLLVATTLDDEEPDTDETEAKDPRFDVLKKLKDSMN